MKTKKLLGVIALSTLLGIGTLYAVDTNSTNSEIKQKRPCKGGMLGKHHKGSYFQKIMTQLDLTDEQKKSLKALKAKKHKNCKANHKAMQRAKQMILANAITADGFNKAQFIADATAQFKSKITQKAENMEKIFAILTPKQRIQFVELLQAEQ